MKKLFLMLLLAAPVAALASGGEGVHLDDAKVNLGDRESLQRGARIFVNYCLSCHSAAYMRYNRMGHDLGLTDELVKDNLLFAADKVGDPMKAVMSADIAKATFNTIPPDLSVIARSRGADYLYTYLRSFYRDKTSLSGWNNTVFPHVSMPNVLTEWQGEQRPVYRTEKEEVTVEKDGKRVKETRDREVFDHFELEKAGSMSTEQFDASMRDLTSFLVYLGEPAKLVRYKIGVYVLIFLALFFVVAYRLKKEYWKDVH